MRTAVAQAGLAAPVCCMASSCSDRHSASERAPTTTLADPVDLLPTYAVGESVMLGAAPQLQAGGVLVNAAVSRQGGNVADVVGMLRAAGQLGRTQCPGARHGAC